MDENTPPPVTIEAQKAQATPPTKSRTVRWFALLGVLSGVVAALQHVYPEIQAYVPNGATVGVCLSALALVLRALTSTPLAVGAMAPAKDSKLAPALLLAGLALGGFSACQGPNGSTSAGVVASVTIGKATQRPAALVRYDGNTFVAWGYETYTAEMYVEATGSQVLLRTGEPGVAMVRVRKPELVWQGKVGEPLPAAAAFLFRESEVQAWGLAFLSASGTAAPSP